MNSALQALALRKQVLQARSTLYRLEIQSGLQSLGEQLPWLGIGTRHEAPASLGAWLAGMVLRRLAGGALGRGLMLTSAALLALRLAKLGIGFVRGRTHGPAGAEAHPTVAVGEG